MKYATGRDFRRALEDRIRNTHHQQNIPLFRLRKQIAFERFLARLVACHAETWILKGGLALQLSFGLQARTTKDIDLHKTSLVHQTCLIRAQNFFSADLIPPIVTGNEKKVHLERSLVSILSRCQLTRTP